MANGEVIIGTDGAFLFNTDGERDICEDCCGTGCTLIGTCGCGTTAGAGGVDNTTWPRLRVTICWTDADPTKSFLGCTWTNGESKLVCAKYYSKTTNTTGVDKETWKQYTASDRLELVQGIQPFLTYYGGTKFWPQKKNAFKNNAVRNTFQKTAAPAVTPPTAFTVSSLISSNSVSSASPALADWPNSVVQPFISDDQFGFVTDYNGVTISWSPADGTGHGIDNFKGVTATELVDPCFKGCCANHPIILATVTGNEADSPGTNETIHWLGETWTPAQAGQQRAICPTSYTISHKAINLSSKDYKSTEFWNHTEQRTSTSVTANKLRLSSAYYWSFGYYVPPPYSSIFTFYYGARRRLLFEPDGIPSHVYRDYLGTMKGGLALSPILQMGLLSTTQPYPRKDNYRIQDNMFGSFTVSSGVTYTWARGDNWT